MSFTSRNFTRSSQWILGEKTAAALAGGRGESNHLEVYQNILFFLERTVLLKRRNYLTRANLPGRKDDRSPATSRHQSVSNKEGNREALLTSTAHGHRITKWPTYSEVYRMHLLPPHPLTSTLLKAYLLQFLLPSISCQPFIKKLQGTLTRKKQFEEIEEALESESDIARMVDI